MNFYISLKKYSHREKNDKQWLEGIHGLNVNLKKWLFPTPWVNSPLSYSFLSKCTFFTYNTLKIIIYSFLTQINLATPTHIHFLTFIAYLILYRICCIVECYMLFVNILLLHFSLKLKFTEKGFLVLFTSLDKYVLNEMNNIVFVEWIEGINTLI